MRRAALLGCAAALAALTGCSEPDTVVLVLVDGTTTGSIVQLHVDVTVADQKETFTVPEKPEAIILPASFTVRIPRDRSGTLQIAIDALGQSGAKVGQGSALYREFKAGEQNQARIVLQDLSAGGG